MKEAYEVLQIGEPSLNEVVPEIPVEEFSNLKKYQPIINRMITTCLKNFGKGLAANQVGLPIRMFIMKNSGESKYFAYFNPIVIDSGGRSRDKEGCLSFREPTVNYAVRRKLWVKLEWINIKGEKQTKRFEQFDARCVQHELDHLEGITMDMVGSL